MEGSSTTLSIILKLVDDASAALQQAGTNIQSALEKNKTGFATLAIESGVAFAGITAGAATSLSDFSEFDTQIQKAGANVGASADQLQQFRDVALQTSADTGVSATDAANALFYLAGGSVSAQEAADALSQTVQFAKANNLDLTQATLMASQAMTLFKVPANDVQNALDLITKSGEVSYATTSQLSDAFSEAAPIASQLGVPMSDLSAILGAMADTGHLGSDAGVALKRAFEELVKPTKETKDGLATLGLSVSDVQNQLSSPITLLQTLQDHLANISDPVQKAAALSQIFGQIAGPAMSALLANGTDAIKNYKEQLSGAAGATQDAFGRIQSAEDPLKQMDNDLHNLSIEVGQSLAPAISGLVQALEPFLAGIGKWVEEHPKLAAAILGLVAGLLGLTFLFSTIGLLILTIGPVLGALGVIFSGVAIAIAAVGLPVIVVGILIAALALLIFTHWHQIIDWTSDMMLKVADAWNTGWTAFSTFFGDILEGIMVAIKSAVDYIEGIVQGLFDTVSGIVNKIISAINSVSGAVSHVSGGSGLLGGLAAGIAHTIIPFASGGIVTGPTIGLIGEAGPEAIIPLSQLGAGGSHITVNITGNTISSKMDLRSIANEVGSEIVRVLRLNQRLTI